MHDLSDLVIVETPFGKVCGIRLVHHDHRETFVDGGDLFNLLI